MSGEPLPSPVPAGREPVEVVDDVDADLQTVLGALGDPDCRRVLRAVADVALTANECARSCEVPLSTTYRKLGLLEEAGLVAEQLRIRRDGKHASEYRRQFDEVRLSVGDDGRFAVDVIGSLGQDAEPRPDDGTRLSNGR